MNGPAYLQATLWNKIRSIDSTSNSLTPADVAGLVSGIRAIAAGDINTCAVTIAGGLKCWGLTGAGALAGDYTPVDVAGLTGRIRSVASGGTKVCALTTNGGVECFGLAPVPGTGLASGVRSLALGQEYFACAATNKGGVKCWGNNSFGQLGDGTTTDSPTPVDVVFGTGP